MTFGHYPDIFIFRVGQKKKVFVHRFCCVGTVEERIASIQKQKLELASQVLTGAKRGAMNKLTMDDLVKIFDLSNPKGQVIKPNLTNPPPAGQLYKLGPQSTAANPYPMGNYKPTNTYELMYKK